MTDYIIKDGNDELPATPYLGVTRIKAQKIANRTGRAVTIIGENGSHEEIPPISEQHLSPWR